MNVELGMVKTDGLHQIAELANRIWQKYYPPIVGQAQVDYMLEKFYNREALLKQAEEGQHFCLIYCNDKVSGFISFTRNGDSVFFINKFYIETELQGKGIGEKAMNRAFSIFLNALKNENISHPLVVHLTVNRMNYKAINFYFKNKFSIRETADFDIGNGYFMNDFIMERRF